MVGKIARYHKDLARILGWARAHDSAAKSGKDEKATRRVFGKDLFCLRDHSSNTLD